MKKLLAIIAIYLSILSCSSGYEITTVKNIKGDFEVFYIVNNTSYTYINEADLATIKAMYFDYDYVGLQGKNIVLIKKVGKQ